MKLNEGAWIGTWSIKPLFAQLWHMWRTRLQTTYIIIMMLCMQRRWNFSGPDHIELPAFLKRAIWNHSLLPRVPIVINYFCLAPIIMLGAKHTGLHMFLRGYSETTGEMDYFEHCWDFKLQLPPSFSQYVWLKTTYNGFCKHVLFDKQVFWRHIHVMRGNFYK